MDRCFELCESSGSGNPDMDIESHPSLVQRRKGMLGGILRV